MLIFVNCAQLTNLSAKSFGDEIDQTKNTRTKGGTRFLVGNKGEKQIGGRTEMGTQGFSNQTRSIGLELNQTH